MSSRTVIAFDGHWKPSWIVALAQRADLHPESERWRLFVKRAGGNGRRAGPLPPYSGYLCVTFKTDDVPTGFRSMLVGVDEEQLIRERKALGTYNQIGRDARCRDFAHAMKMAFLA